MTEPHKKIEENLSFFDRWASTYDRFLFQFWMKKFHVPVLKELLLNQKTKVLDISCGTGELLKKLEGKAELHGIDLSQEGQATEALLVLGYSASEAKAALKEVADGERSRTTNKPTLQERVREALKILGKK